MFEDREQAFENKFKHDQEIEFKVSVRRAKLVGLWAAEKMGLNAEAAEAYAKEVVSADLAEAGDADLVRKVKADLAAQGVAYSDADIENILLHKLEEARHQIMTG